jgi:hypothetical protein
MNVLITLVALIIASPFITLAGVLLFKFVTAIIGV